jgi:hypothetical protein
VPFLIERSGGLEYVVVRPDPARVEQRAATSPGTTEGQVQTLIDALAAAKSRNDIEQFINSITPT